MAAVINNLSLVLLPSQLGNSRRCFFKSCARPRVFDKRIFAAKVRASSTAFVETKPPTVTKFLSAFAISLVKFLKLNFFFFSLHTIVASVWLLRKW